MQGHEAMEGGVRELFRAAANLHAEIATRIHAGDYVDDNARITGRRGSEEIRVAATYDVATT